MWPPAVVFLTPVVEGSPNINRDTRQLTNLAVFKSAARAQRSEIKRRVSTSRLLHQLELLVSVAGLALPLPHLLALCSGTGVVEA